MEDASQPEADEILDVRGEVCPFPLVRTQRALAKLEVGQVLRILGDYGPSLHSIIRDMKSERQAILKAGLSGEVDWEIVVRKQE